MPEFPSDSEPGRAEEADVEPVLRECLTIHQKQIADSWLTFNTQSLLGGALLGQKNTPRPSRCSSRATRE